MYVFPINEKKKVFPERKEDSWQLKLFSVATRDEIEGLASRISKSTVHHRIKNTPKFLIFREKLFGIMTHVWPALDRQ